MPSIYHFIIIAAALFGILRFSKVTSAFFKIVLAVQIVSIALTLLGKPQLTTAGLIVFYSASLATALYGLTAKGKTSTYRGTLIAIALPGVLVGLFKLQHWPYVSQLMLLNVVAILAYLLFVLPKRKNYNDEFATLTIITSDALITVLLLVTSFNS